MQKSLLFKLFTEFFKVGALTFGGGYAMIPMIEKSVVEETGWLNQDDFVDMIAICQCLPGAFALNAAVYVGYRVDKKRGAAAALFGVVLPSFLIILLLSGILIQYGNHPIVKSVFLTMIPAVVALVGMTALNMAKKQAWNVKTIAIALIVIVMLFVFKFSPVWAILVAAIMGIVMHKGVGGRVV